MTRNTILIAGATGVVGAAAVEHFATQADWQVVALSRRAPGATGVRHVALDLGDRTQCLRVLGEMREITHVLFAALYEKPDLVAGWRDPEQMSRNLAMLRNLLDGLAPAGGLRHVTLLQGTKAYGSHVGPVPVPLKERWPRHPHENFYWLQEDLLRERQPTSNWSFTILRPQFVFGHAVASPMNIVAAIGAYAAVMRELGRPLAFPGGARHVTAATDARLIARAAQFAGTHPAAANETYNVVNGDVLVWEDLWPAVARHFGMTCGDPVPMQLAEVMPLHEDTWRSLARRLGLHQESLAGLVGSSWQFADRTFQFGVDAPRDTVMSPIKLRQAGFADCHDTEDTLVHWLTVMQQAGLLPR